MHVKELCSKTLRFFKIKDGKHQSENHEMLEKQQTKQIPFPFDQLSFDLICQVASFLSLKDVCRFANTNLNHSQNQQIWKLAANNLGIPVNNQSLLSQKLQIKEFFIKEFPLGIIDFLNKKVFILKFNRENFCKNYVNIFEKYAPLSYFFKDCLGLNTNRITYRDAQGVTKQILAPGTAKSQWLPGEKQEWVTVHKTMNELKIEII